jgi:hypothetical protein
MKMRYFLVPALLIAMIACSKDKYQTKPQITIKSIGPDSVARTDIFTVDLNFTDKEGDIHDSLFMHMHVLNLNQQGTATEFRDFGFPIPTFPDKTKGEFQLNFARQIGTNYALLPDPSTNENDTVTFSFNVRDSKNNMSDTVTANKQIVILSQ